VGGSVAIVASGGRGGGGGGVVSASADYKCECQSLFLRSFYYQNGAKTGTVTSAVAMISVYCRPILKSNKCMAYQILHLQIQTGNQCVQNDPRADEIWILHTEFLHIVYIWVLDFFCVWHLENPGWLKGEILGSNGTITLPAFPSQLSTYCEFACYSICCSEGFLKCRQTSSDHPHEMTVSCV